MEYKIRGTTLQVVDVTLKANEKVFTETGGMAWMSPNIEMKTNARGGIGKAVGRLFSQESFFMTEYSCQEGTGLITFCNEFPGKIVDFNLKKDESIICQKDAFMLAEHTVELSTILKKKIGAGLFGGEGFFLQKLTGPGKAFLELAGEITEYTLKKDQSLKVDTGYIAAFEPTVDYDITLVKGVSNILFGGEGLFLATLTGPGKVWLQSMPLKNLARRISTHLPHKK